MEILTLKGPNKIAAEDTFFFTFIDSCESEKQNEKNIQDCHLLQS